MKFSTKTMVIVGALFVGALGLWYISGEDQNAGNKSFAIPVNSKLASTKVDVKSTPTDKIEAYNALNKEQNAKEKQMQEMIDKDKSLGLSTVSTIIVNPHESKMEAIKSESQNSKAQNKVLDLEQREEQVQPKVYKSSLSSRGTKKQNASTEVKETTPVQKNDSPGSFFNSSMSEPTAAVVQHGNTNSGVIKAQVFGKVKVTQGCQIRFRTTEEFTVDDKVFPRNTIIYGKVNIGQERLFVNVDRIAYNKGYVPLKMILHDLDLQEGLYSPTDNTKGAVVAEAGNSVDNLVSMTTGNAALVGRGVGGIIRTFNKQGQQEIPVNDGEEVLFIVK